MMLFGCGEGNPTNIADMEQAAFDHINAYRVEQGLSELEWSDAIAKPCRIHSENMAAGHVDFGHGGFDARIATIRESLSFTHASENVATNQGYEDPAHKAFDSWLNSPPHLANLLGDHDLSGMGVAINADKAVYFTQIFIHSAN